ncbi:MAG: hypothetical protein IT292_10785 [Deltaproteobacteria bacterium]|nr:hypothetical protein [Deltaproteobacteria bacterium]
MRKMDEGTQWYDFPKWQRLAIAHSLKGEEVEKQIKAANEEVDLLTEEKLQLSQELSVLRSKLLEQKRQPLAVTAAK